MTLSITRGGSATSTTAGTTLTVTPGAAAVGTAVILLIACDNSGTAGVAPTISISTNVIDSWRQVGTTLRNPSSTTNTGVAGFAYQGNVVTALTGSETVTITFGSTTTAKAALCWITSASVTTNQSRVFGTTAASGSATSANSGSASVTTDHIAIGFVAWETNLTVTGDSDANGGATWSALTPVIANTGTDTSSITLVAQWKLPTSTVAQALNPAISAARNYAGLLVDIQESQRATGTATPVGLAATATASGTVATVTNQTWTGTDGTASLIGSSGTFTPGAITWAGSTGTATISGTSQTFTSTTDWTASASTISQTGASGTFTAGPATWTGNAASILIQATSGDFGPVTPIGSTGSPHFGKYHPITFDYQPKTDDQLALILALI